VIKRVFLVVGICCVISNLNAINPYQSLRDRVVGLGQALEKINNIPLVGKPTNLLPIALVAASLQKCPGQTMMMLAGLLVYVLANNESVRAMLSEYNFIGGTTSQESQISSTEEDETLFVFDGEDDEDAQEESDTEDELLGESLLDEEYEDQENDKRLVQQQPPVKFL